MGEHKPEDSGEFLALDASMTEHIAQYNRVVELNRQLAHHLNTVTFVLHKSRQHAGEVETCRRAICALSRELLGKTN